MDTLTKFAQALGLVLILSLIIVGQGSVSDAVLSRAGDVTAVPAAAVVSVRTASIPEVLGIVPGAFGYAVLQRFDTMFSVVGIGGQATNPAFSVFIPWQEAAAVGGVLAELDEDGYSPESTSEAASYSDTSSNDYGPTPAPTYEPDTSGYNDSTSYTEDRVSGLDSGYGDQSWFPGFSGTENPYGNVTDWLGGSSPSVQSGLDAATNGFGFQFGQTEGAPGAFSDPSFSASLNEFSSSLDSSSGAFSDTTGGAVSFLESAQDSFSSFFTPGSDNAFATPASDEKGWLQKTEDSFGNFFGGTAIGDDSLPAKEGMQQVAATENDMGKPSNRQQNTETKDESVPSEKDSLIQAYEDAKRNCAGDQACVDKYEKCTLGPVFQSMLNLYGTVPIEIPGERESRAAGQAKLEQIQTECSPSSSLIHSSPFAAAAGSVQSLVASVSAADSSTLELFMRKKLSQLFSSLVRGVLPIEPALVMDAFTGGSIGLDTGSAGSGFGGNNLTSSVGGGFDGGIYTNFGGSASNQSFAAGSFDALSLGLPLLQESSVFGDTGMSGGGAQSWLSDSASGFSGFTANPAAFLGGSSQGSGFSEPQDISSWFSGFSLLAPSTTTDAVATSTSIGISSGTAIDNGSWTTEAWNAVTSRADATMSLVSDTYYNLLNDSTASGANGGTNVNFGNSGSANATTHSTTASSASGGQSIVDTATATAFIPGSTASNSSAFIQAGYTPTDAQSTRADCIALATQAAQNEQNEVDYLYVEKSGSGICMRRSGSEVSPADAQAMSGALTGADSVSRIHTHPLNATFGMNVPPPALDVVFENGFIDETSHHKLQMLAVDSTGSVWQYETTPGFNKQTDRVTTFVQNPQIQEFLQSQGIDVNTDSTAAITASLSTAALGAFGRDLQSEAQTISKLPIGQIAQYQNSFNKQGSLTTADIDEAIRKYKAVGVTITKIQ